MTTEKPKQPDPQTPDTRRDYTFRMLKKTWGELGASPLGRMTVNPDEWLATEAPELKAKIEAATEALYKVNDEFCAMKVDKAAFMAAGKAWRSAWLEAAALAEVRGVVAPIPPPAPPKPEVDPFAKPPCSGCGRTDWVATVFDPNKEAETRYCHRCLESPKKKEQPRP